MSRREDSDWLTKFSQIIAKVKLLILELVIFMGFLMWLWDKVNHDFNTNFRTVPTAAPGVLDSQGRSPN